MVKIKDKLNNDVDTIKEDIKGELYTLDVLGRKDVIKKVLEMRNDIDEDVEDDIEEKLENFEKSISDLKTEINGMNLDENNLVEIKIEQGELKRDVSNIKRKPEFHTSLKGIKTDELKKRSLKMLKMTKIHHGKN